MKLKNNKGYVITDVSIAIIILLILVPVIMGIVYRTETTRKSIELKAEAINIAVNTLEAAKGIGVTDLVDAEDTTAGEKIFNKLSNIYSGTNNNGKINYEEKETSSSTTDNNNENIESATIENDKGKFLLLVKIEDFAVYNDAERNVVKTVNATVNYKVNQKVEEINLSTVLK